MSVTQHTDFQQHTPRNGAYVGGFVGVFAIMASYKFNVPLADIYFVILLLVV